MKNPPYNTSDSNRSSATIPMGATRPAAGSTKRDSDRASHMRDSDRASHMRDSDRASHMRDLNRAVFFL